MEKEKSIQLLIIILTLLAGVFFAADFIFFRVQPLVSFFVLLLNIAMFVVFTAYVKIQHNIDRAIIGEKKARAEILGAIESKIVNDKIIYEEIVDFFEKFLVEFRKIKEIADSCEKIETAIKESSSMEKEIADSCEKIETAIKESSSMEKEIADSCEKIETAIKESSSMEKEIADSCEKIETAIKESSSMEKEIADSCEKIETAIKESSSMEKEIWEFQKKITVLIEQTLEYEKEQTNFLKVEISKIKNDAN